MNLVLKFHVGQNYYAINLKYVQEIIEYLEITPYPEPIKNHVGIINLRGKIIPVIELFEPNTKNLNIKQKIIVIEWRPSKAFALCTNKAQKFTINKDENLVSGQTININMTPTLYLDELDFEKHFKDLI